MIRRIAQIPTVLVLMAAVLFSLMPLLWMVAISLTSPDAALGQTPQLWPKAPSLVNYERLVMQFEAGRYALNSLAVAGSVTVISVLINALAGYAFAKLEFTGRERIFRWMVSALVIPGQVGMLPLFLLLKPLGLINSYAGVIVPGLTGIFGIFLVRQFAQAIPDSILNAARIDGASEWRIFRSIVLPLCRPILTTLAVLTFMGTWNDFLWPVIVLMDADRQTLPVALANLMGEHAQDSELMMAGSVLTLLPVVLLFAVSQRVYLEGLLLGSVKE